jgi:hypothetical protein
MAYSPVILTIGDRRRLHKIRLRLLLRVSIIDAEEARLRFKLAVCEDQLREAGVVVPRRMAQGELRL